MADGPVNDLGTSEAAQPATPPPLHRVPTADQPRVCWICYADSTEDDESTAHTWRSPCPCALTAHESCLLDWVADLENPKNRNGARTEKIQCPQCKSEIKVARPKSLVIEGMKSVDKLAAKLTLPGVVLTFAGTLWAGAFYHGFQSVMLVFGPEDAERILEHAAHHRGALRIGLPLIPLNLIMARTRYSDFFLPATTLFLWSNQLYDKFELDFTLWPPTASTAFACLPLIRNTYCALWDRAFGKLEKQWLSEVQPRAAQNDNQDDQRNGQHAGNENNGVPVPEEVQDGDVLLEFNIDIGLGGNDNQEDAEDAAAIPPPIANPNPMPNVLANDAGAADEAAPVPAAENNAAPPNGNRNAGQNQNQNNNDLAANANALVVETSSLATTMLGALAFPAISAGMGRLLELGLPSAWTVAPALPTPPISPFNSETLSHIWSVITGRVGEKTASGLTRLPLLQTRWGRTVIGGCLFVVVKDFVLLYWRYRLAKNHRERRIMEWDRQRSSYRLPS